jgi:ubiquitin C-terminal hydrolase
MNSIIQILSNCKEIREFFLDTKNLDIIFSKNKEKTLDEIIKESHNQLNFQFGKVIANLWDNQKVFIPFEFKQLFGKKIELFQGSDQQDSQEALICIMDTIHNELELPLIIKLNKNLKDKESQIFNDDYNEKDIQVKALRSLFSEIKKSSIIKELFQGLLNSKMECPKCHSSSHTFDPILHLTLTFPQTKKIISPNPVTQINTDPTGPLLDIDPFTGNILSKKEVSFTSAGSKIEHRIDLDTFVEDETNEKTIGIWYDNFNKKSKFDLDENSDSENPDFTSFDDLSNDIQDPIKVDLDSDDFLDDEDMMNTKQIDEAINKLNQKEELQMIANTEIQSINNQPNLLTLKDLLDTMLLVEVLDDSNKWHCDQCNEKVNGHKSMNIWYLPEILVIHLKRFEKTYTSFRKITEQVIFPLDDLDLSDYLDEKSPMKDKKLKYELFAINNHQSFGFTIPQHFLERMNQQEQLRVKAMVSSGIDFGHYYSYCKNGTKWYEYNDETVKEINENDLITDRAYLLFYRLK